MRYREEGEGEGEGGLEGALWRQKGREGKGSGGSGLLVGVCGMAGVCVVTEGVEWRGRVEDVMTTRARAEREQSESRQTDR